jgi:Spy/CpxP family protein refolding chaperone
MHPSFYYWWKQARSHAGCGAEAGCGTASGGAGYEASAGEGHGSHGDAGGGPFGVRRPLRFLAYKLELDEGQVAELARVLSDLKTERAQADVDGRRALSAFADAVGGATFDAAKAGEAAALRVKSAERLRDAVVGSLERIHRLLKPEQREKLAYLIRTGTVTL